jgi:hypothetical protein
MRAIACAMLALVAGCAVESDEALAWRACAGIEPWQAHSACLQDQYRQQRGQDMQNQAIAATLLGGGRPVTTCFRTGSMTQCQ